MPEVFLNYRVADTAGIPALIESELSRRFGSDHFFHAPRSIEAGTPYPEALLSAVRRSRVLLALIGHRWAKGTAKRRLHDPDDWVRREIVEALAHEVTVIPVLVGAVAPELNAADLPEELAVLTRLQARRLDPEDPQPGLQRIGDALERLVPGLRAGARAKAKPRAWGGPLIGTYIEQSNGPLHTGTGPLYAGPWVPPEDDPPEDGRPEGGR